ncbi:MAG: hypothetical protein HYZ07_00150 [Candidatus Harrisonbacteria bacterium]|nr:hypothetical protein [Candidatus Harrisonbacteria bacterium]
MGASETPFSGSASARDGTYIANCSSCGKTTTVPFAPDPSRPVYCKDCLTRVKAGEILPVKLPRVQKKAHDSSKDALAAVGIEFEAPPQGASGEAKAEGGGEEKGMPEAATQSPPERPPEIVETEPVGPSSVSAPENPPETPGEVPAKLVPAGMSLAELKPARKAPRPKEHTAPEVDVDELRKSIAASLDQILKKEDE